MAKEWQRNSALIRNRTHVVQLFATSLNHSAIGSCQSTEKNGVWLLILLEVFRNLQRLFCVQNCRSWIAQVEYQGQASNTRILEHKPWIDTFYRIRHRLELKYFHFAQFWAAHRLWKSCCSSRARAAAVQQQSLQWVTAKKGSLLLLTSK